MSRRRVAGHAVKVSALVLRAGNLQQKQSGWTAICLTQLGDERTDTHKKAPKQGDAVRKRKNCYLCWWRIRFWRVNAEIRTSKDILRYPEKILQTGKLLPRGFPFYMLQTLSIYPQLFLKQSENISALYILHLGHILWVFKRGTHS